jgi:hypothetical protein
MPNYRTCPNHQVDPRARALAAMALTDVCRELKIEKPALNWISEEASGREWFPEYVFG